jgi:hypothetical protein
VEDKSGDKISEAQLAIWRDTFRYIGVLGKLYNIVIYIRSSIGRMKDIKAFAGRRIPLNNRTRWNSWFYMLDVAL